MMQLTVLKVKLSIRKILTTGSGLPKPQLLLSPKRTGTFTNLLNDWPRLERVARSALHIASSPSAGSAGATKAGPLRSFETADEILSQVRNAQSVERNPRHFPKPRII